MFALIGIALFDHPDTSAYAVADVHFNAVLMDSNG